MSAPADETLNVPHALYRCLTVDGELLYVGVARNVGDRMYHHLALCNAGKQPNGTLRRLMADYTVEWQPTKIAARAAERAAVHVEAPLLNRQHNPRRFRKVGTARYGLVEPAHPISVDSLRQYADSLPTYPAASA